MAGYNYEKDYEFCKDFVKAAVQARKSLNDPSTLAKFFSSVSTAVPGSTKLSIYDYILHIGPAVKLANTIVQLKDARSQQLKKAGIQVALNSQIVEDLKTHGSSSLTPELLFIRVFVDAAVEIFYSFENQLEFVGLKVGENLDNRQGRTVVAQLAAQLCFRQTLNNDEPSIKNIVKVIGQLNKRSVDNTFSKLESRLFQLNLKIQCNDFEKEMSAYKFLKRPIPAWKILKEAETFAPASAPSNHLLILQSRKAKFSNKYKNQAILLRRPMNFEWDEYTAQEREKLEIILIDNIKNHDEINVDSFVWQNKSERSQAIFEQLICDQDFDFNSALMKRLEEFSLKITNVAHEIKENVESNRKEIMNFVSTEIMPHLDQISRNAHGTSRESLVQNTLNWDEIKMNFETSLPVKPHTKFFVGREHLTQTILQKFSTEDTKKIVITAGLGGVGKTELARKVIDEMAKKKDVLVVWVDSEEFLGIAKAMAKAADVLKVKSKVLEVADNEITRKDLAELSQQIYLHLSTSNQKSLFVFDNAESEVAIQAFLPQVLMKLQPAVLITSRTDIWRDLGYVEHLKGFNEMETLEYFTKYFALEKSHQNSDFLESVKKFWDASGGYTLTVVMAASYIKKAFERDIKGISDGMKSLLKMKNLSNRDLVPSGYDLTPEDVLKETFPKIKKESELAWQMLSQIAYLAPDFITVELCCQLLGGSDEKVNEILPHVRNAFVILQDFSIVYLEGWQMSSKIWTHRVVQKFLRESNENNLSSLLDVASSLKRILQGKNWRLDLIPHVESVEAALEPQKDSGFFSWAKRGTWNPIKKVVNKTNALKLSVSFLKDEVIMYRRHFLAPFLPRTSVPSDIICNHGLPPSHEFYEISLGDFATAIFKYLEICHQDGGVMQYLCGYVKSLNYCEIYPMVSTL